MREEEGFRFLNIPGSFMKTFDQIKKFSQHFLPSIVKGLNPEWKLILWTTSVLITDEINFRQFESQLN